MTSNIDVRRQQRAATERLHHERIKQVKIVETLWKVHGDKALFQLTVCQWLDIFKSTFLDDNRDEENVPLPVWHYIW